MSCSGGFGELVEYQTALFVTLFYNDSMFSTSTSLTDTLREMKMSPMYTLEPSDNENFIPEKSLRTWNIVISNPQHRVCLRCEPGTSQESRCTQSNYISIVLMPNITHLLRHQRLKEHEFREGYTNRYLKLAHIGFY